MECQFLSHRYDSTLGASGREGRRGGGGGGGRDSKRLQGKQTHAQVNKTETYQYEIFALTLVSDSVPLSPSTHALSPSPLLFVCPSITGPHSDSWSHLPLAVEVTGAPRCSRLFVGCLTSQQHTSVSQGRICPDNFTCSLSHSILTPGRPVPALTL